MIKIVTVIGARPQIIKAAAISRAIATTFSDVLNEIIIHTGQHYDENMSGVFFREMGIPTPTYNLEIGSASHGKMTAAMLEGLEDILIKEKPNYLLVYGDTNSTLAGSLAASKLNIPVVHIEAGLRSFNKAMPEEINRIVCDHVSTLLFCPTQTAVNNLLNEGFKPNTGKAKPNLPAFFHCGDIMLDNTLYYSGLITDQNKSLEHLKTLGSNYLLVTIHRDYNTDNAARLTAIFKALLMLCIEKEHKVVLPLHPRTRKILEQQIGSELYLQLINNPNFYLLKPVSFLEMIELEKNCSLVLTDSGGVQKEAYFLNKPCLILRTETEWVELLDTGTALLCDADEDKIINGVNFFLTPKNLNFPPVFGDGNAANFICEKLIEHAL